jgi:hypothetical protein
MAETSGEKSIGKWNTWVDSMTDQDYVLITESTGKLNRRKIREGCGFSKSVLGSNPVIAPALIDLEIELRGRGVLPELTEQGEKESSGRQPIQKESKKTAREQSRVPYLEQQVIELKSENDALKGKLGRFSELNDVYNDLDEL